MLVPCRVLGVVLGVVGFRITAGERASLNEQAMCMHGSLSSRLQLCVDRRVGVSPCFTLETGRHNRYSTSPHMPLCVCIVSVCDRKCACV